MVYTTYGLNCLRKGDETLTYAFVGLYGTFYLLPFLWLEADSCAEVTACTLLVDGPVLSFRNSK